MRLYLSQIYAQLQVKDSSSYRYIDPIADADQKYINFWIVASHIPWQNEDSLSAH